MMKLALGTVQFGTDYGAFSVDGQVSPTVVADILDRAALAGVDMLDTALAYGNSEQILAKLKAPERFQIVTKCPPLGAETDPAQALQDHFATSCERLGVDRIYGYLLHDSMDIARHGVMQGLSQLRDGGAATNIGVSGYDVQATLELCETFPIDLVQVPANALSPWFDCITFPDTVEVHVRSVFLQGFLLSDPTKIPSRFRPWRTTLEAFRAAAQSRELSQLEAALAPVISCPGIDRVIVGIDSLGQLEDLLTGMEAVAGLDSIRLGPFPDVTQDLIDPRRWSNFI